jgi:hypothetical protein
MTSTIQIKFSKSYESRLRRLYAITLDDFVYIVEFQQGSCPICLSDLGTDMSVDHDHLGAFNLSVSEIHRKLSELTLIERRKLVRGILHVNCNSLLGRLERNPWLISEHVRSYLDRDRKIAEMLSEGHTGREVAKLTGLSPARISQISKELRGDIST